MMSLLVGFSSPHIFMMADQGCFLLVVIVQLVTKKTSSSRPNE